MPPVVHEHDRVREPRAGDRCPVVRLVVRIPFEVVVRPDSHAGDAAWGCPRPENGQRHHQQDRPAAPAREAPGQQAGRARREDHRGRYGVVEKAGARKEPVEPIARVRHEQRTRTAQQQPIPAVEAGQQRQRHHHREEPRERPFEQVAVQPQQVPRRQLQTAQGRVRHAGWGHVEPGLVRGAIEDVVAEKPRTPGRPCIGPEEDRDRQRSHQELHGETRREPPVTRHSRELEGRDRDAHGDRVVRPRGCGDSDAGAHERGTPGARGPAAATIPPHQPDQRQDHAGEGEDVVHLARAHEQHEGRQGE